MNKIKKFLRKLSPKERRVAEDLIGRIIAQDLAGLDVKKLQGIENIFRVRKGDVRILYALENGIAIILEAVRRNDTTYNL